MSKFNDQPRGSGKTKEVIEIMHKDEGYLCLVPNNKMKKLLYPKDLQDRIITMDSLVHTNLFIELRLRSRGKHNSLIIDELLYSNFEIAKMFYQLGINGISVIVYGTDNKEN